MISDIRKAYNQAFSQQAYEAMMEWIAEECDGYRVTFRVAETPIFIPASLRDQLIKACNELVATLVKPDFLEKSLSALLPGQTSPNETAHTNFLVVDFGICHGENGEIIPQLVEIQGFPSLYLYQPLLARAYRKFFDIPQGFTTFFNNLEEGAYTEKVQQTIIGDCRPENVILLEIDPIKQNTAVDFVATKKALGIDYVCISDLRVSGRQVYYEKDGKKIPVDRIYNRIIFDELERRPDLARVFDFTEDYDVQWAGHPNWFFRISKHTLPLFNSKYVPTSHYLHTLTHIPDDLDNYVLKPLYSFAGSGVNVHPTLADIEAIADKDRPYYILQQKMHYASVIETPTEPAKCEVRMMLLWPDDATRPELAISLVRLSKGEMVGVRFNKNKDWVGSSAAFFER